jgi:hypothetical protein
MNQQLRIFIATTVVLLCTSCGAQTMPKNQYYDEAKALAEKVSTERDQQAWKKLLEGANSSDFWTKYYSVVYLEELVKKNSDLDREITINQFVVSLSDARPETQAAAIEGLISTGSEGVGKAFDKLKAFVLSCNDNTVSWNATDALGLITDIPQVKAATSVLVQALLCKTQGEDMPGGPRLRDMALASLSKIGTKNPALVQAEIEKMLPKLDVEYAKKAAALVVQLNKKPAGNQ